MTLSVNSDNFPKKYLTVVLVLEVHYVFCEVEIEFLNTM